jgi:hypothetical protein
LASAWPAAVDFGLLDISIEKLSCRPKSLYVYYIKFVRGITLSFQRELTMSKNKSKKPMVSASAFN